jgi:hypothetical protein
MFGRVASMFGIVSLALSIPVSVGATIPAPTNGVAPPYAAPISLAMVTPSVVQPAPAVQTQPDPAAAWAARMVRDCVKVGSRMSC